MGYCTLCDDPCRECYSLKHATHVLTVKRKPDGWNWAIDYPEGVAQPHVIPTAAGTCGGAREAWKGGLEAALSLNLIPIGGGVDLGGLWLAPITTEVPA